MKLASRRSPVVVDPLVTLIDFHTAEAAERLVATIAANRSDAQAIDRAVAVTKGGPCR